MPATLIIIMIGLMLLLFLMMIWAVSRYIKCPPDKLLVIYGRVEDGNENGLKVLHGGAAFVWPVIQDHEFIDLAPFDYPFRPELLTKDLVAVKVSGAIKYGVANSPALMNVAATRLLGIDRETVERLGGNIIISQLTKIVKEQDVVEIATFKNQIAEKIALRINTALNEIGLQLINITLDSISDRAGFIKQFEQAYKTKKALTFNTPTSENLQLQLAAIDKKIEQNTEEREVLLNQKLELLVKNQ